MIIKKPADLKDGHTIFPVHTLLIRFPGIWNKKNKNKKMLIGRNFNSL